MAKRVTKKNVKEEANPVVFTIAVVLLILIVKGCDAYCEAHYEQWDKENKEYLERNMQEAYYNCKFEHDY